MRFNLIFLLACLLAAAIPLWQPPPTPVVTDAFPGWPATCEGRALLELPRTIREQHFERGFPGRIGRFSDGQRELVIRWVARETRMLHPATDCFRGLGYRITSLPLQKDAHDRPWGAFIAERENERLRVRELITDGGGQHWSDASAWYWAVLLHRTHGPWWAFTVAERYPDQ